MSKNTYPKLHNAIWPGIVGKGTPGAEPFIPFDTMLDLTASAEVDGVRFDGIDLNLSSPHFDIDSDYDDVQRLAEKVARRGLQIGTVGAPVWEPTGGGSSMGSQDDRNRFLAQVRKACDIGKKLREIGIRPDGIIRIDSACDVSSWRKDRKENTKKIVETFTEATRIAADHGERLAAEGEICWGGMHSWQFMLQLLEAVGKPELLGFQADMAHTLLYILGVNAPKSHRLVPSLFSWQPARFHGAMKKMTKALRPWTIDFHVAQNDATVKGSGTHDKTGRHCLPDDPHGKLNIARDAGYWLRDGKGVVTKKFRHICWDGCMFPNDTLQNPETWRKILVQMIQVRENHGWTE
ncbi:MAG: sugar phosphate isomerase/epimerase [Puniceicoccales bacterium]|jgi:sugar phosphate isomerase/epimerase|nr:sugar phosphate isomerase/epimerase [Puniceicoccales bacterium]